MEKKNKKIVVIITMMIILLASYAISYGNNGNNNAKNMFDKGIIINTGMSLETILSSDYNIVESEIKNKLNNNWTELNNEIANQIKKSKNSTINPYENVSKIRKEYMEGHGWEVEEKVSTAFDEGHETWDFYVFTIKYSELTVNGKIDSEDNSWAYIIINKNTGECRLWKSNMNFS